MSRDGHLPPGVEHSDIPGNTPEDEAWDNLWDWLMQQEWSPEEVKTRLQRATPELEVILERIATWLDTLESRGGAPMPDESEFHFENEDDFIRGMEWAAEMVRKCPEKVYAQEGES